MMPTLPASTNSCLFSVEFGGGFSSQVFAGLSQQLQVDELPKQPNVPCLVAEGLDLGG